ncbi:arsenate reductase (azurin) small subunit [Oceanithermus desulfurans]|uniref:Arsenate reductase (Azurin) small subunit n=1 Tax=Oceanithermus profundus TaxID=187137 RepID=A0A7C5WRF9_9DEIN|nr:arsenate reductase (azurin) small subunit [Oceanithermus profundus]
MTAILTRRRFVQLSVASVALFSAGGRAATWFAPSLTYPSVKVGNVAKIEVGKPAYFNYPDNRSQAVLVKLGREALGGVGKDRDLVAFSASCTHMGCGVQYKGGRFVCPCHQSMFDPAKNGQVYQGLASEWLPQIPLRVEPNGDVIATAVEGLIWGRVKNV